MSEWKKKTLKQVSDIRVSNVDKKIHKGKSLVKLCNYMDVYSNDYINSDISFQIGSADARELMRFSLKYDDVIITKDSETPEDIAVSAVVNEQIENLVCGYHLAILRPDTTCICGLFLMHKLKLPKVKNYFCQVANGSTRYGLTIGDIEKVEINIPTSLAEQRKIARILSSVDSVIENTEAAIAKYEAIKTGMMHDLFTRGIDLNTGKLRPSYEEAPELYKESELGWTPKDWDVKPLSRLTTQIGDGIHTTPKYSTNTPYFFINGNNLTNGRIVIPNECPCVDEEEYKKHFQDLNNRTILYSINGTIGNIAFYDSEKVILGKSAAYISCSKEIDLGYIYFNLQTEAVTKFYKKEMTGSTINNLSLASIRNTPIIYPKNNDEQNEIVKRLNSINKKIEIEHLLLSKYQQLKQGLMSDILTCKVWVKYEEDKVEYKEGKMEYKEDKVEAV